MSKLTAPGLLRAAEILAQRAREYARLDPSEIGNRIAAELRDMEAAMKSEALSEPGDTRAITAEHRPALTFGSLVIRPEAARAEFAPKEERADG